MNTSTSKIYYPQLDALRGIAILLVLLYHYFSFPVGWMGVDLFSYFLVFLIISNSLFASKESNHFLSRFYKRRILRIFPIYYLALVIFYLAARLLFSDVSKGTVFHYYTTNQIWFWTFTSNWLFIREGIPPEPYLQHLWSLAVEEQFYVVWPLAILFVPNMRILRQLLFVVFAISLACRILLYYDDSGFQGFYYNTIARLDSFSSGAFLSTLVQSKRTLGSKFKRLIAFLFVALITSAYLVYGHGKIHNPIFATIGYSVNAVFFTILCQHFITAEKFLSRSAFLLWLGKISYGIYIYHLPVFLVVSYLLSRFEFTGPEVFTSLLSTIITLIISFLSYKFVEVPFLRLKQQT